MYKKLFGSILIVFSMVFFISCEKNEKKDMKETREYRRGIPKKVCPPKQECPAPKKVCPKPCVPPAPKKVCPKPCLPAPKKECPKGCKKKCCVNENSESEITQSEETVLQEQQEEITAQELSSNLPLEDLKAAIENDSLEFGEE